MARFYLDEDVPVGVSAFLTRRGHQTFTTVEAGNLRLRDAAQLLYATDHDRILVTHNRGDYRALHEAWVKHISSREARANFADLLGAVYYTGEPVVVEKKGKPVAVVISPATYQAFTEASARDWAVIKGLQAANADRDPDEVMADVTAAVKEVRGAGREVPR